MEKDTGIHVLVLRVDGGPTRNKYLMQFQSDILNTPVSCPEAEELSGIGAAMMAGIAYGLYQSYLNFTQYTTFVPVMDSSQRNEKLNNWQIALSRL